jgi:hypothetical protein
VKLSHSYHNMSEGSNRMRDRCFEVVSFFGDSWGYIGWGLFLGWFFLVWFVPSIVLWFAWSLLLLVWWVIDAVDREVEWWKMAVVLLVAGRGFPSGSACGLADHRRVGGLLDAVSGVGCVFIATA